MTNKQIFRTFLSIINDLKTLSKIRKSIRYQSKLILIKNRIEYFKDKFQNEDFFSLIGKWERKEITNYKLIGDCLILAYQFGKSSNFNDVKLKKLEEEIFYGK